MTTCDVLIVGGGPAGSACAWKLRDSGLDVLILDKKTFPRDKPCAGWITPQIVDELQLDLNDYRQGRVLESLTGFGIAQLGGREVVIRYDRPISYGIRRCEFDDYLLRRTGAACLLGQPLKTLQRDNGGWLVNGEIRASLVVGAGGHFCPVARFLGARPGAEVAVAAQEVEFAMSEDQLRGCPVPPGVPFFYFCTDLRGYGWYYRKGNHLNVGLGREDGRGLADHVAAFCRFLKEHGRIPQNTPERFVGHAYLLYEHARREVVGDGVVLIGDAAGIAYPQSGEGIRPAVESGLLAAEVILVAKKDFGRSRLEPYRAGLEARFGRRGKRSLLDFVPFAVKRMLAGRVMASRWFARNVILDRWFLRKDEPPLDAGGIRRLSVLNPRRGTHWC
jgi:geranylgeranyl reductase family protein